MKHIKTSLLTLALLGCIAQNVGAMEGTSQASTDSSLFGTIGSALATGAYCVGSTAANCFDAWNGMPERIKTAAYVVGAMVIYHNYQEFLQAEKARRANLCLRMIEGRLTQVDALKELSRFRNKVCPFLASKSVETAVREYYGLTGRPSGDQKALKNALAPEWKPFWLWNSWF